MAKIRRIEPNIPSLSGRKRVAAYARVSMETELLHHSLSAQVSHYSSLIQSNPEWEYVLFVNLFDATFFKLFDSINFDILQIIQ